MIRWERERLIEAYIQLCEESAVHGMAYIHQVSIYALLKKIGADTVKCDQCMSDYKDGKEYCTKCGNHVSWGFDEIFPNNVIVLGVFDFDKNIDCNQNRIVEAYGELRKIGWNVNKYPWAPAAIYAVRYRIFLYNKSREQDRAQMLCPNCLSNYVRHDELFCGKCGQLVRRE
jgi:ribosomal protein S27AE